MRVHQIDITTNHKYAVKWALNDFALWVDGVEIATDTSGATFPNNTLNQLRFSDFGTNYLYANTKQAITFNEALSDLDLAILTGATTYNTFAAMALALNYTVYE